MFTLIWIALFIVGIATIIIANLCHSKVLIIMSNLFIIASSIIAIMDEVEISSIIWLVFFNLAIIFFLRNLIGSKKASYHWGVGALIATVVSPFPYSLIFDDKTIALVLAIAVPLVIMIVIGVIFGIARPRIVYPDPDQRNHKTNLDPVIGKNVVMITTARAGQIGVTKIGDIEWGVIPANDNLVLEAGRTVVVEKISGVRLVCSPYHPEEKQIAKDEKAAKKAEKKAAKAAKKAEKKAVVEEEAKPNQKTLYRNLLVDDYGKVLKVLDEKNLDVSENIYLGEGSDYGKTTEIKHFQKLVSAKLKAAQKEAPAKVDEIKEIKEEDKPRVVTTITNVSDKTPVVEEPVVEESVVEEAPVVEKPVVEEPVVEEAPVVEEPVVEEPVVEEAPVVEEPSAEKADIERISFAERLLASDKSLKEAYNELKSEILSYGIKSRVAFAGDAFRLHTKTYVKITVAGKSLKLYFALDPNDYADSTMPIIDASKKILHKETPLCFKVKSDLSIRRAKQLIADAAKKDNLEQGEVVKANHVKAIKELVK